MVAMLILMMFYMCQGANKIAFTVLNHRRNGDRTENRNDAYYALSCCSCSRVLAVMFNEYKFNRLIISQITTINFQKGFVFALDLLRFKMVLGVRWTNMAEGAMFIVKRGRKHNAIDARARNKMKVIISHCATLLLFKI